MVIRIKAENGGTIPVLPIIEGEDLMRQIERCATVTGIPVTVICRNASRQPALYNRLKRGGGCTLETHNELQRYMEKINQSGVANDVDDKPTENEGR